MSPRRTSRIDPNTLVLLRQIAVGVAVLAGVALFCTGVWYGTRLEAFTIDSVEVNGGETIDHEAVRAVVEAELDGEYLGFVPRRFTYLFPRDDIHTALADVDRIHSVKMEQIKRTTLRVSFDEYVPTALWCASGTSDECFFLSADGYAFAPAPQLRGGAFLRYSHLQQVPERGATILFREQFQAAQTLVDELSSVGWYASHVEVDQVGDAFLKIAGGSELKVSLSDEPATIVENLLVILGSEEFQHLEPGNFAYIDLRFGEKVFVNEELSPTDDSIGSSTATSTAVVKEVPEEE